MSQTATAIDEVIRNGLAQELRAAGFCKTARTWRKRIGAATQITNVQASWTNAGDTGKLTINLGVYFPEAVRLFALAPVKDNPAESDCIVHQRIGLLMPVGADRWWSVTPGVDREVLGHEVAAAWRTYGQPWLDAHVDIRAARTFLQPRSRLWAAIFCVLAGEIGDARQLFEQAMVEAPSSAFRQHEETWRANLGLPRRAN